MDYRKRQVGENTFIHILSIGHFPETVPEESQKDHQDSGHTGRSINSISCFHLAGATKEPGVAEIDYKTVTFLKPSDS